MGMPNSLGNFAWGCQIPCSVGDTKNTEGVPKSLGDLARGAGSPMTPAEDGEKCSRIKAVVVHILFLHSCTVVCG